MSFSVFVNKVSVNKVNVNKVDVKVNVSKVNVKVNVERLFSVWMKLNGHVLTYSLPDGWMDLVIASNP